MNAVCLRLRTCLALIAGALTAGAATARDALAKVEGDWIVLGSVLSFTGKYSTKGVSASSTVPAVSQGTSMVALSVSSSITD